MQRIFFVLILILATCVFSMEFTVNNYTVRATLEGEKLFLNAHSGFKGKIFEATVQTKDLSDIERAYFGDCDGVLAEIQNCLSQERKVQLSDRGELTFNYLFGPRRREGTLRLKLKEVEMTESHRLTMRIEKFVQIYESKLKLLEQKNAILEEKNSWLQKNNTRLEERLRLLETKIAPIAPFQPIVPQLDMTTPSIDKATVDGLRIICNKGINEYQSFFLSNLLEGRQSFEIEFVITNAIAWSYFGLGTQILRDVKNSHTHANDSLVLQLISGESDVYMWREGKQTQISKWPIQNGSRLRISVDYFTHTVTWQLVGQLTYEYKAMIPSGMRNKRLMPAVHIRGDTGQVIRFV